MIMIKIMKFDDKEKEKSIIDDIMTTEVYAYNVDPKACKHLITNVFVYHGKDKLLIIPNDKDIIITQCLHCDKVVNIMIR